MGRMLGWTTNRRLTLYKWNLGDSGGAPCERPDLPPVTTFDEKPFLTVHISERTAIAGWVAVALIVACMGRRERRHPLPGLQATQPAQAPPRRSLPKKGLPAKAAIEAPAEQAPTREGRRSRSGVRSMVTPPKSAPSGLAT